MKALFFGLVLFSSAAFACPDLGGKYSCVTNGDKEKAFEYTFSWAPKEKLYVGAVKNKKGDVNIIKYATTGNWIPSKDIPNAMKNAAVRGVCEATSFTSYFRSDLIDKDGTIVPHTSETKYYKEGKNLIEDSKEVMVLPSGASTKTTKRVCTPLTSN